MRIALCFSQFGPYHHARAAALRVLAGESNLLCVQIAAASTTYAWDAGQRGAQDVVTLLEGAEEDAGFIRVLSAAWCLWKREEPDVAFLPSYSPASSLALLLSAKLAGLHTVMMNDSHAGTERARGWKRVIKRYLIWLFDGALLAGQPQVRHFQSLGIPSARIRTGYDAIDNAHFTSAAAEARTQASQRRARYGLPERYILSLGRMVEKKNLETLIEAFALAKAKNPSFAPALVFVGSGEREAALVQRSGELGLRIARPGDPGPADVWFFGFRQIDENPDFYALADCFVLPSRYEEWGLVVNEAMACGLPVVVSQTVGCAEDLVQDGVNGFQFDPAVPEDLAQKLLLLESNPALRASMGAAGRERIQAWGCDNFAAKAMEIARLVGSGS